jgi:hypothetical protein
MAVLRANGTEVARLEATRQDPDYTIVHTYSLRSNGKVLRRAGTSTYRGHWKVSPYAWKDDPAKAATVLGEILRGKGFEVTT